MQIETPHATAYRRDHIEFLRSLIGSICQPIPNETVTEWACEWLRFNEPGNHGPFSVHNRRYIVKPLNSFKDRTRRHTTMVFGTQSGKTAALMAGTAWTIKNNPQRILWVHPDADSARVFSQTRWLAMIRASRAFDGFIPTGSERHKMSSLIQHLCGSIIGLVGSHSPSKLAGTPAGMVIMDELDKFNKGIKNEAGAKKLAENRTKNTVQPKHVKTSTPTTEFGDIWVDFLEGDQQRYYVPCPGCRREIVLAWLPEFEVLPKLDNLAFVAWDREAKTGHGEWDWDRVNDSAHFVCPFCERHIIDADKPAMIEAGRWVATAECPADRESYHLPSMYAISTSTRVGVMVVKFLQDLASPDGVQDFVNSYLALPFRNQTLGGQRVEIRIDGDKPLEGSTTRLMTVDCQLCAPFFWWAVMDWTAGGDSRVIEIGKSDTDQELQEVQKRLGIADNCVAKDAGNFQTDVIASCLQHGKEVNPVCLVNGKMMRSDLPFWQGWIPMKGNERRLWKDPKTQAKVPWTETPIKVERGTKAIGVMLLLFSRDDVMDTLDRLRDPQRSKVKTKMEFVNAICTDEFWSHMDAEHRAVKKGKMTWRPLHEKIANHWLACMRMQVALAIRKRLLRWGADFAKPPTADRQKKVYELKEV